MMRRILTIAFALWATAAAVAQTTPLQVNQLPLANPPGPFDQMILNQIANTPTGFKLSQVLFGTISSSILTQANVLTAIGFLPMNPQNNLSDLANVAAAQTNLGLGPFATATTINLATNVTGVLPVANGGTGGLLPVINGGTGATFFTPNLPLIGAGGSAIAQGTISGNTTVFATAMGTFTSGDCVSIDGSGNVIDAGGPCTTGGGGGTVASSSIGQLARYTAPTVVTGFTMAGDCTISPPNITCSEIGGVPLALGASFTTTGTGAATLAFPSSTAVYTYPGSTDTLVGLAATQTLSNKTFVAPALGTVASGNLAAATGYAVANLTGAGTNVLGALADATETSGAFVRQNGAITAGNCVKWSTTGVQDGGSSCSLAVGVSPITGGANNQIVYDNSGLIGVTNAGVAGTMLQGTASAPQFSANPTLTGTLAMGSSFLRNVIVNGAGDLAQRTNGGTLNTATGFALDQWALNSSAGSVLTVGQDRASGLGGAAPGFGHYIGGGAITHALASTDYFTVAQTIEANNFSQSLWGTASAKAYVLSFWVQSGSSGTFGGVIQNAARTRSYPFTYSVSAGSAWQLKSVAIPGDTGGTWVTSGPGGAVIVAFSFGGGSSETGTAGSWSSNNWQGGATGQVSNNGGSLIVNLDGVQFEVGTQATPYERLPYNQELAQCQRYFETSYSQGTFIGTSSTFVGAAVTIASPLTSAAYTGVMQSAFKATKRAVPAMTFYSPSTGASAKVSDVRNGTDVNVVNSSIADTGFWATATNSTASAGYNLEVQWAADAGL